MLVHEYDSKQRGGSEQTRERLEMKVAIDNDPRAAELSGDVEFAPDILVGTGEDGLAVSSVATKFSGEPHDALNVLAGAVSFSFVLDPAEAFACEVFNQNDIFFMGFVTGCRRLIVEADCT